jgi:large subunit ribosomal protein L15
MKLHDLRPAPGSRTERTRVGRGIAAGKGKTAGRGTKGQKARAGGSIPPWFEGGQTPLHVRIPKLRGFKNRFKLDYEIVNVGAIGAAAARGAFETEAPGKGGKAKSASQVTINQDILRAVGLVRTLNKPLKILGAGELETALFVVADAFTASARSKIEAAGGTVNVLEIPTKPMPAIGREASKPAAKAEPVVEADAVPAAEAAAAETTEVAESPETVEDETPAPKRASRAKAAAAADEPAATDGSDESDEAAEESAATDDDATSDDA